MQSMYPGTALHGRRRIGAQVVVDRGQDLLLPQSPQELARDVEVEDRVGIPTPHVDPSSRVGGDTGHLGVRERDRLFLESFHPSANWGQPSTRDLEGSPAR